MATRAPTNSDPAATEEIPSVDYHEDVVLPVSTSASAVSPSIMSTSATTTTRKPPTASEAARMFVFSAPKAGMHDVDTAHVQSVVFEMSKDSLFFQNSIKQNDKLDKRIADMKLKLSCSLTSARREFLRRQIDSHVAKMETTRDLTRTKVVIDMDMFYAAVEMRENPRLRDKPLAVGGMGMLSTTNYVARKFGVRAAMPGFIGKELCPELVIVPPNFDKYTAISAQIRAIVAHYDPQFQSLSLDEVYCDLTQFMEDNWTRYATTGSTSTSTEEEEEEEEEEEHQEEDAFVGESDDEYEQDRYTETEEKEESVFFQRSSSRKRRRSGGGSTSSSRQSSTIPAGQREAIAAAIVNEIRHKIWEATQLTASAGVAVNTMLAKICSDVNKPNGQFVLPFRRDAVLQFMEKLPVRKIGGIGKVMDKTLSGALEIVTAQQLFLKRVELFHLFTERTASWLLRISRGLPGTSSSDSSDTEKSSSARKGYSRERTFSAKGIQDPRMLERICLELCETLASDLQEGGHGAKTLTLKLKCVDFSLRTRAVSCSQTLRTRDDLFANAMELLRKELPIKLRLMGVRASALVVITDGSDVGNDGQLQQQGRRKRQVVMDEFTRGPRREDVDVGDASTEDDGDKMDGTDLSTRAAHLEELQASAQLQQPQQQQQPSGLFKPTNGRATGGAGDGESAFQPCPICGKMINAGNAITIELHVDACLRRSESHQSHQHKQRRIHQFFQS